MEEEKQSFIKNWQKIYFIDFNQNFNIHKNIINQIVNDYNNDKIDFHVAYVPIENNYLYEPENIYSYPNITLPLLHDILKRKLAELKSEMSIEMSIVYNTLSRDYSQYTMTFTGKKKIVIESKGASTDIEIQQYSRAQKNLIQLENRNVRLKDKGKYIKDGDEREFGFTSINMFPEVEDDFGGLRAFLSSVANENNYKNKENRNDGIYYKFEYKVDAPTIQINKFERIEHADVPYNKFRIELKDDGKIKSEEYEFPRSRIAQKGQRALKNVTRPFQNLANDLKHVISGSPKGGKTRKHRKKKMRSSKRKASKKGRKSRKKKSSSRKKK